MNRLLTKQHIAEAFRVGECKLVADDGWFEVVELVTSVEEVQPKAYDYKHETTLGFKVSSKIIADKDAYEAVSGKLADQLHQYLYGDIMDELHKLRFMIDFKHKEDVISTLDKLIRKLEGDY